MQYTIASKGCGVFELEVINQRNDVLAKYTIIDHSTEQGLLYVVQRTEDYTKQLWTDSYIHAIHLCKEDYKHRHR